MSRRVPRQPQSESEILQQQIDALWDEIKRLKSAGPLTIPTVDTTTYHGGTQGEVVLHHDDASPALPTKRVRVNHLGDWYDVAPSGSVTPWVGCWDTYYGATYSNSTTSELFFSKATRSDNSDGIFGIENYIDPQYNSGGFSPRYAEGDWHRPIIVNPGVYAFTLFFEFTDRTKNIIKNNFLIYPDGLSSGGTDLPWFPHEDSSGFGFFRGIRFGSPPDDQTGYSQYGGFPYSATIILPLMRPDGDSDIPNFPWTMVSKHVPARPSADTNAFNQYGRAALYIMYLGSVSHVDPFPDFP